MANTQRARLQVLLDYFSERIAFLADLESDGRREEALVLCCCYIEAFGKAAYPQIESNRRRFVTVIEEHGRDPTLKLVVIQQLLGWLDKKANALANRLDPCLRPHLKTAMTAEETLEAVRPHLDAGEFQTLSDHLWAGTVAAVAYERVRNSAVHELFAVDGVCFPAITTRTGAGRLPDVDFDLLHHELSSVFQSLSSLTLTTGKLFGTIEIP